MAESDQVDALDRVELRRRADEGFDGPIEWDAISPDQLRALLDSEMELRRKLAAACGERDRLKADKKRLEEERDEAYATGHRIEAELLKFVVDDPRHRFSREQCVEVGRIVVDNWGAHFQTGFDEKGIALWVQVGPNTPVIRYIIEPDGTVTT